VLLFSAYKKDSRLIQKVAVFFISTIYEW